MARIKQLSPHEAQKIAAGEVVERPANVVKELVENSIDAGATSIAIYIEDAGKKLVRIVDNGCGMSQEDAHLCFKHHATSKITSVNQLSSLATFGFRGEALSSIAAVSKIQLLTKEADASLGTRLILENLYTAQEETVTCNTGTDLQIADLFYNVPARKKFLKTTDTEWRQITLLFNAFCLDYRDVHFSLYHNNALVHSCPPVLTIADRIAQLYDHTVASQLIPVEKKSGDITLEGVISAHTYGRYDRSAIVFLVNKRWVKNHTLSKALLKGYANVLPPDKYPLACLNITLDPAQVDINIHPRKEEVQFLHPRLVEQTIQAAVKEGLEQQLSKQLQKQVTICSAPNVPTSFRSPELQPTMYTEGWSKHPSIRQPTLSELQQTTQDEQGGRPFVVSDAEGAVPVRRSLGEDGSNHFSNKFQENNSLILSPPQNLKSYDFTIIGQLHKTYLIIEEKDGLMLIDQHAAHERILYEQFATRFAEVATIPLLFPPTITLTDHELAIVLAHNDVFTHNHIMLEQLGTNQIMVQAVPAHLKEINLQELVRYAIGTIEEHQKLEPELLHKKVHEKLHAQMACKAAVKAGDILTHTQMHQLVTDLQTVNNRVTCPHGRPTTWNISLYEIEKKFKRKL